MWKNFLKNFIKYFVLLELIFMLCTHLQVSSDTPKTCTGKHEMRPETIDNFDYQELQPIKYIDFDKIPNQSHIENNGLFIRIDFWFDGAVPRIEIDFENTLGFNGTYRFDFLYFHWLQQIPDDLVTYENLTYPAEFHAVFYDVELYSFNQAVDIDKGVAILSFEIQVDPLRFVGFEILQHNLKFIRKSYVRKPIGNRNLNYWLQTLTQRFRIYEGSFLYYTCETSVIWIDYLDTLTIKPEVIKEFAQLKAPEGNLLMQEIPKFLKPQGKVYQNNVAAYSLGSAPAAPLFFKEMDGKSGVERAGHLNIKRIEFLLMILFWLFYEY